MLLVASSNPHHVLKQVSCLHHWMPGTSPLEGIESSCPLRRRCQTKRSRPQNGHWNVSHKQERLLASSVLLQSIARGNKNTLCNSDGSFVAHHSHVSSEDQLQLLPTGQEELEQAPNSWAEGVFYLFFMGGLRLFVEHIYIYIYIVFQKLRGSCHNRPRFRARFRTPSAPILIYRTLTCGWLVVEHRLWNLCHMQLG